MSEAPPPAPAEPSGRPGRYPRSTNGLVGSLVVTVVVVVVGFALLQLTGNSDDVDVKPEPVDYLAAAQGAQQAGEKVIYPADLPPGWVASSVHLTPGDRPAWGIGMLTDDGSFAGLRQEDASLDDLLATYVDEEPTKGPTVTIDSDVATRWQSFSDSGGDHAYAAEVGHDTVLVYGSASTDDLRTVVGSLTKAPLSGH